MKIQEEGCGGPNWDGVGELLKHWRVGSRVPEVQALHVRESIAHGVLSGLHEGRSRIVMI